MSHSAEFFGTAHIQNTNVSAFVTAAKAKYSKMDHK
jgi:hypothetical protein